MPRPLPHPSGRARRALGAGLAVSAAMLAAEPAFALQPVTEFLEHARTWNPQNRAARATTASTDAQVSVSTGSLLPSFSASGTYTRNQYEVTTAALIPPGSLPAGITFPNTVIQPQNQLDANLTLNIPIINVGNWDRRAVAKATLAGAHADEENTQLTIAKGILRDYYTLLGNAAVVLSANKNVEVARNNVALARDRKENGTGSELDVQRALADQAKAEQSLTGAELQLTDTRRDLYSLSGLEAGPVGSGFPEDDLHEEQPLAMWTGKTSALPSVRSAEARRVEAEESAHAAHSAWYPTVSADGQERFTNATAFVGGHTAIYLLQLSASWKLDTTIAPQIRAQNAAASAARANVDYARLLAEDAVFRDWQQIHADIESSRSARVQVAATQLAASLAEDRYKAGVATQLDVLQARQDAFSADVARIQSDADLAYARLALRLDAGQLGTLNAGAKEMR